jgi:hypothetical protein
MVCALCRVVMLAAVMVCSASLATAAPVVGPSDDTFYTAPSPLPDGSHGDLIWYRTASVNLGADAPQVSAWNVMYLSTDAVGAPNAVTGTVLVPAASSSAGSWSWSWWGWVWNPAPAPASHSVILYAVGTHGLAQKCAPSKQMPQGMDYETANLVAALKAGYAVLVSDYAGYTNGDTPTYLAGISQGHAVLDIFKAASQIPASGVAANSKAAIWGYSQGGQSAGWAGQLQPSYAPSLPLVGVAAGGIPADFIRTGDNLNGNTGASFLLSAVVGLAEQYPADIPLNLVSNDAGKQAIAQSKTMCVFQSLFTLMNDYISQFTVGGLTLHQLELFSGVHATLVAQDLGGSAIPVPVYQYHGLADEFIPLDQAIALKQAYCGLGGNVTFGVYPGEHIITQFQAAPYVLSWLADRFAGKSAASTCSTTKPAPQPTANPGGGNYVVSMKNWPLNGTVHMKTLNQSIAMPAGANFTADADLTAQKISGTLSVPSFTATLRILGLPINVRLSIVAAGSTTGTASLDNDGNLHVHGHSPANLTIVSGGISFINIPLGCMTSSPVDFAIDFDGPIASLGNGNLTFTGTTTFPWMTGCGLLNGVMTALMSGPGQTYSLTVSPPSPSTW